MRQPLVTMTNTATALSQWVTRSQSGCSGLLRFDGCGEGDDMGALFGAPGLEILTESSKNRDLSARAAAGECADEHPQTHPDRRRR